MKEQIQQLIAEGRTEDALYWLIYYGIEDAQLLQARFNNGKKQYNTGLIDLSEWQRTQAQISYTARELSNQCNEDKWNCYTLTKINGVYMVQLDFGENISEPRMVKNENLINAIKSELTQREVSEEIYKIMGIEELWIKDPCTSTTKYMNKKNKSVTPSFKRKRIKWTQIEKS